MNLNERNKGRQSRVNSTQTEVSAQQYCHEPKRIKQRSTVSGNLIHAMLMNEIRANYEIYFNVTKIEVMTNSVH